MGAEFHASGAGRAYVFTETADVWRQTTASPHIHAWHGEDRAVVDVANGQLLAGSLKPRQARLVRTWVELHRAELIDAWERAAEGEPPGTIEAVPRPCTHQLRSS
ncbi:MAG: DUF4160 domain-containing protein [Acidimicrobiales bacterium]